MTDTTFDDFDEDFDDSDAVEDWIAKVAEAAATFDIEVPE